MRIEMWDIIDWKYKRKLESYSAIWIININIRFWKERDVLSLYFHHPRIKKTTFKCLPFAFKVTGASVERKISLIKMNHESSLKLIINLVLCLMKPCFDPMIKKNYTVRNKRTVITNTVTICTYVSIMHANDYGMPVPATVWLFLIYNVKCNVLILLTHNQNFF